MITTEADRIWAAGFFEGEGSISITKTGKRGFGHLSVCISNTDAQALDFFHVRWPGYMRPLRRRGNQRPAWRWMVASRVAASFLRELLPYLRTEKYRQKALLAIEYQEQKTAPPGRPATDAYRARQEDYYERMRALNLRGAAALAEVA